MQVKVTGIILKETTINEKGKVLTIFTKEFGKISVFANDAKNIKNSIVSTTSPFCYGNFVLFHGKTSYVLNSVDITENFFDISKDIYTYSLGIYFLDIISFCTFENDENDSILSLILNCLYALVSLKKSPTLVKSIFELKIATFLGYMPALLTCENCGNSPKLIQFDIESGLSRCENCSKNNVLPQSVYKALIFITYEKTKKAFSFNLSDENLKILNNITENYLLNKLERNFKTLEFYKSLYLI